MTDKVIDEFATRLARYECRWSCKDICGSCADQYKPLLREFAAAYEAAKWRPISEAPTDGSWVNFLQGDVSNGFYYAARWSEENGRWWDGDSFVDASVFTAFSPITPPTDEEDTAINQAIASDPDTAEITSLEGAMRGAPATLLLANRLYKDSSEMRDERLQLTPEQAMEQAVSFISNAMAGVCIAHPGTFPWAYIQMEQGKRVRRRGDPKAYSIAMKLINDRPCFVRSCGAEGDIIMRAEGFETDDIVATDWEVKEE